MTVLSYLIADAVVKSQWITAWRYWRLFGSTSCILQLMPSWHNSGKGSEVCSIRYTYWRAPGCCFHTAVNSTCDVSHCRPAPWLLCAKVFEWRKQSKDHQRDAQFSHTILEKCEDRITAVYLTSNGASAIPPTRALSDTIHKVYTICRLSHSVY